MDLSQVQDANVKKYLEANIGMVRMTLMQADLEFEYPQKIEKMKIKADILEMVHREEEKLEFSSIAKKAEEARKKMLTYEEYFQLDPLKDGHLVEPQERSGSSKGDTTLEQFLSSRQSDNMFYNDLLEMEYKFWETDEDKQLRIKKLWIDLKRKNALGHDSPKKRSDDFLELN